MLLGSSICTPTESYQLKCTCIVVFKLQIREGPLVRTYKAQKNKAIEDKIRMNKKIALN